MTEKYCDCCGKNPIPIDKEYGCPAYCVTLDEPGVMQKEHNLCRECYDKIYNILAERTRRNFAQKSNQ